jgi:hypothetical protein
MRFSRTRERLKHNKKRLNCSAVFCCLFALPVGGYNQRNADHNADAAVDGPFGLARHVTSWQDVDALQKPDGSHQHSQHPKNGHDTFDDFHAKLRGFWIYDFGFTILDLRFWIYDFGFTILDLRFPDT